MLWKDLILFKLIQYFNPEINAGDNALSNILKALYASFPQFNYLHFTYFIVGDVKSHEGSNFVKPMNASSSRVNMQQVIYFRVMQNL